MTRGKALRVETPHPSVDRSHASPLPPGAGPGSMRVRRPAGDGERGCRGRPTPTLPGRGRGEEVGPGENEGTAGWILPPLPEGAVPGSQYACRAADSVAQMGPHRRSAQARNRLGNRALLAIRVDKSRSKALPSLSPGAAPGSQDSGGVGSSPSSSPLPRPGATSGQRHQESSDPMEVDPVSGEALQETRRPHERRGDATREHSGGRISTRTRARTRAAGTSGERTTGSHPAPPLLNKKLDG